MDRDTLNEEAVAYVATNPGTRLDLVDGVAIVSMGCHLSARELAWHAGAYPGDEPGTNEGTHGSLRRPLQAARHAVHREPAGY